MQKSLTSHNINATQHARIQSTPTNHKITKYKRPEATLESFVKRGTTRFFGRADDRRNMLPTIVLPIVCAVRASYNIAAVAHDCRPYQS